MKIVAETSTELVRQAICLVNDKGVEYRSSDSSMNKGKQIKEVFNTNSIWLKPRCRIYTSPPSMPKFRVGLAVARFFYLLSGSNHLAPISFYAPSVSRFSDDGITIPGSSYGHRIFGDIGDGGQFEKVVKIISSRPDTKRAAIAIYQEGDAGRESKDIPCASALVFMPRGDKLHMTLQMRANDVMKLMSYNLFEFSLLMECMAAQTGHTLGEFHHTAVSLHLRGDDIKTAQNIKVSVESPEMSPITTFNNSLRVQLVETENLIRTQISYLDPVITLDWFKTLTKKFESVWLDLIGALLLKALQCVQKEQKEIDWLKTRMLEILPEAVLLPVYHLST